MPQPTLIFSPAGAQFQAKGHLFEIGIVTPPGMGATIGVNMMPAASLPWQFFYWSPREIGWSGIQQQAQWAEPGREFVIGVEADMRDATKLFLAKHIEEINVELGRIETGPPDPGAIIPFKDRIITMMGRSLTVVNDQLVLA